MFGLMMSRWRDKMKLFIVFRIKRKGIENYGNTFVEIDPETGDDKITEDLILEVMEDIKKRANAEMVLIMNIIRLEV